MKRIEILSFIEGEAGNYPLKEYMRSNDVLKNSKDAPPLP